MSALTYAIVNLKVKHVIICGHTSCWGCKASLSEKRISMVGNYYLYVQNMLYSLLITFNLIF